MNTDVMFSSRKEDWETPQELFDELNREFCFTVDVCADDRNHKCDNYFRKTDPVDGLHMDWTGTCWMNPPYGREIGKWIKKASEEVQKKAHIIVCLLPVRTDTKWFHEYIYGKPDVEIRFLKRRLKFSGESNNAPFPNMIVIFRRRQKDDRKF